MRKVLVLLLCWGLAGCAGLETMRATNRENLLKLSIGMTKQEVLYTMETRTISSKGHRITNPYRSETLQGKDKALEVLYYYTDVKRSDGEITEDELTPIVFDDSKVIGWGWGFLQDNKEKYGIKMR